MSDSHREVDRNFEYNDFIDKASFYMKIYLECKNDKDKWRELNVASAGLFKCLGAALKKGYEVPDCLVSFFNDNIYGVTEYQVGRCKNFPSLNSVFGLQVDGFNPPRIVDSTEIFVSLISSFIFGMFMGELQRIDSSVPMKVNYINPYIYFLKHSALREKSHISYIKKINNDLTLRSFLHGYINGLSGVGRGGIPVSYKLKSDEADEADVRVIHLNLAVDFLARSLTKVTQGDKRLNFLSEKDIRKLLGMFIYHESDEYQSTINKLSEDDKKKAQLIGTSFSSYMITGADFAALSMLHAQTISNNAKKKTEMKKLVDRICVTFDSFMIEHLNCFKFPIVDCPHGEWSGVGPIPQALTKIQKDTLKEIHELIIYFEPC